MELNKKISLRWRRTLDSEEGRDGWTWLIEQTPEVVKSDTAHEMHFDAGRVQGYREALSKIQEIANMREESDKTLDPTTPGIE